LCPPSLVVFQLLRRGARTPAALWKTDALKLVARVLQRTKLKIADFEKAIDLAGRGDFVYCDSTYTDAHDNNGFIRYNERNFSWSDHERLAEAAFRASNRGALVIVTNANQESIRRLYRGSSIVLLSRTHSCTVTFELKETERA
jgi:DNA adenine methylase